MPGQRGAFLPGGRSRGPGGALISEFLRRKGNGEETVALGSRRMEGQPHGLMGLEGIVLRQPSSPPQINSLIHMTGLGYFPVVDQVVCLLINE